ncbi:MAG TPA: Hsp70 family protein, partial [Terriglobia bacterium]|nr:Hsp70 family protein [Terriglobia bacterium]
MKSVIGIDLGTTNCAVAQGVIDASSVPATISIPQLTSPGTVESRVLLPSFLYLPQAREFPEGTLALPWQPD